MTYLSVDLMLTVQYLNQHNCREISLIMYEEQGQTVHKLDLQPFGINIPLARLYIYFVYIKSNNF